MAFLLPLFFFYGLLLFSLAAGLLACAGAFLSRRRPRWILAAGLASLLGGSWMAIQFREVVLGSGQGLHWFTALAPIPLGVLSLARWFKSQA